MMQKSASAAIGRPGLARTSGGRTSRTRRPPSAPAKANSGIPSGSGITAASVMRRRPADEDVDAERHAAPQRRRVMDADAAVNLVVQADLAVALVLVAAQAARDTCRGWSAASRGGRRPPCRPAAA